MSTLAEKWMEEGEKKGLAKGLERGLEKGRKETVRRLIELKFGALSGQVVTRIETADEAQLSRFIERVLTAASVEEALGE